MRKRALILAMALCGCSKQSSSHIEPAQKAVPTLSNSPVALKPVEPPPKQNRASELFTSVCGIYQQENQMTGQGQFVELRSSGETLLTTYFIHSPQSRTPFKCKWWVDEGVVITDLAGKYSIEGKDIVDSRGNRIYRVR